MDNINVVHRYNGFSFVIKKNEACRKMDGWGNYYVKQTNLDTKRQMLCGLYPEWILVSNSSICGFIGNEWGYK